MTHPATMRWEIQSGLDSCPCMHTSPMGGRCGGPIHCRDFSYPKRKTPEIPFTMECISQGSCTSPSALLLLLLCHLCLFGQGTHTILLTVQFTDTAKIFSAYNYTLFTVYCSLVNEEYFVVLSFSVYKVKLNVDLTLLAHLSHS